LTAKSIETVGAVGMDLDLVLSTLRLLSLRAAAENCSSVDKTTSLMNSDDEKLLQDARSVAWDSADCRIANPRHSRPSQPQSKTERETVSFQVLCRGYLLVVEVTDGDADAASASVSCDPNLPELRQLWPRLAEQAAACGTDAAAAAAGIRKLMTELAENLASAY
ncbi:hypothetical protein BOX15_Mlig009037g1, partial [Macrostomum lignano]